MNKKLIRRFKYINWYPPFWGAGIRVHSVSDDMMRFEIDLKLTWWNKNIFGTHFGGSLYAMCDPWFCFIVAKYLGREFIVWDKAAKIEFVKPGRGRVRAIFEIDPERLAWIKAQSEKQEKFTFWLQAEVKHLDGSLVAQVDKEIYVRRKHRKKEG